MENEVKIAAIFWTGTAVMLFLAVALISLVLYYQNNLNKIKRREADLLLKASLASEMQERHRIAADLHDGVMGDLNALRIHLALFLKRNKNDFTESEDFVNIKTSIEDAIENTRLVSYKLMPPLLKSQGVVIALQNFFEGLNKKTTTTFSIVCHQQPGLQPVAEYELFRIIQELSSNIIKYGEAGACRVIFSVTEGVIAIEVIDDGKAYNFDSLFRSSRGSGLKNIVSRIKSIDGSIIQEEFDCGNKLLIKIKASQ
jgi:signal transduction histidine kinase